MNHRHLTAIGTALAISSISTLAMAQTTAPSPTPNATTSASGNNAANSGTTAGGLRIADRATVAVRFVTVKPVDIMSSKLVGINVYNNQNETLGEIKDLVIDNGKTITGLIVGVGGFIGMGESYVVLDPSTIVLSKKDSTWKAFVDTTKDNLKSAPKFDYSKK
jgi:sporulation protein YlmC with PRC-barrel domain